MSKNVPFRWKYVRHRKIHAAGAVRVVRARDFTVCLRHADVENRRSGGLRLVGDSVRRGRMIGAGIFNTVLR